MFTSQRAVHPSAFSYSKRNSGAAAGAARDASEKDPRRRPEVIKGEAEEAYLFASAALETEPEADTGAEIGVAIAAIVAVGPIVAVGHYILRCREGVNGETLLLTEGRRATTHSPWPCD